MIRIVLAIAITLLSCNKNKSRAKDVSSASFFYSQDSVPNEQDYLSSLKSHHHKSHSDLVDPEYLPSSMNIEKFVKYDTNFDGNLSDEEVTFLKTNMSYEEASSVKYLYESRLADLSDNVRKSFLLNHLDKSKNALNRQNENYTPFLDFKNKIEKTWTNEPLEGQRDKMLITSFPYLNEPLFADEVLLISSGDVTNKRLFPLLTRKNFMNYAKQRGYRFSHYNGNMASIDAANGGRSRIAYWSKIFQILDVMQQPKNRVIVWLDDDGIINSDPKKLDMTIRYLLAYPTKDLILSQDEGGKKVTLNSGIMIIRNTPLMREFFAEV